MLGCAKWLFLASAVSLVALQSAGQRERNYVPSSQQEDTHRIGKDLLDWIGLGTGPNVDPYLAKVNSLCLNGDLAECFKSRALQAFDEFFERPLYELTNNARIMRMPETQLRQLAHEPFEYSEAPRGDESEWDQLVKFGMRRVEKFLKSTAMEVKFDEEVTERGRYSPRFVDEIIDEIDVIEDKKDSLFKRKQLKKLFIPMLIILKLFKLKLLLFLPLILGLASFKKLLGFLAIVIPGLIGFFKLCKPDLHSNFGHSNYYNGPHYSPAGIGYQPHLREPQPSYSQEYASTYHHGGNGGLTFQDNHHHAQDVAYSGYSHYRNPESGIKADTESTSRKSILPDS